MADDTIIFTRPTVSPEEIQRDWHELKSRVGQLEAELETIQQEIKSLRFLLDRVVEHRQRSHGELINLLSGLVSKLSISDVGLVVSQLVEHNAHVNEVCSALMKGKIESSLPQPAMVKALEQTKRDLTAAIKPAVEELLPMQPPLETALLQSFVEQPDNFFSPAAVRANRCYVKGQVTRERIVREFGEAALVFFQDLTTDPKLNPRPKPEEIVLVFREDFPALLEQNPAGLTPAQRTELQALYQRIQHARGNSPEALAQRRAYQRLTFILELLHYYEHQNTESPEAIFAQRLPALVEQMALVPGQEQLDEKTLTYVEGWLAHILNPDHRLSVINNIGKGGTLSKTLRYVLRLRTEKNPDQTSPVLNEIVQDFVKHLIPPQRPPAPADVVAALRLLSPELQRFVARMIASTDRLRKEDADALVRAVAKELGLTGLDEEVKVSATVSAEIERQVAWDHIKELIHRRGDPNAVAAAIRERLHRHYDAEELKLSWVMLVEAEPITFIRIFCQLPYLADGSTDSVARAVMETYVSRLTHPKYAAVYHKVVNSLKNMFKANPAAPTLVNFVSLVRWLDPDAAKKLTADVGLPAAA